MPDSSVFVHPQGIVDEGASVGAGTRVWAWAHVLSGAKVGRDCNLCDHTFIEGNVVLGDRVTVKCGVYIWDGVTAGNDVFIGPSVTFTNDKFPRSRQWPEEYGKTRICDGASIGANATILPVTIGACAMVGAGAVVTKDVPPYAIVVGNPARIVGYANAVDMSAAAQEKTEKHVSGGESKTGARLYSLPHFADLRGNLCVLEFEKILPFPVKRIFYTYGVKSTEVRGEHAHKKCEQFLIAVAGSLHVLVDNGTYREDFVLDSPAQGLHLRSGCWGIQYKHSPDCVLLVLASREYEADDYIRNYNDFLQYKGLR
ncbi:MAG: WxcM-like domain-containing protein [Lentisphaeria bacterium]|nr:WxcM-like domain-containing protein [Lentisphaeria bacterium]